MHCCHMGIKHPVLSPERQSARMPKITNDGLTRSGTGCFIPVPIRPTVGVKRVNSISIANLYIAMERLGN